MRLAFGLIVWPLIVIWWCFVDYVWPYLWRALVGIILGVAIGLIIGHVYLDADYLLWWENR